MAGAIRNHRADLIVGTGDITDGGTHAELKQAIRALGGVGVPFRLVPGNHDRSEDWEPGSGSSPWEEVVGPRWWSMNIGGLHLVAIDWHRGRNGDDREHQLRWLTGDLALVRPGQPVILVSHDRPDSAFFHRLRRESPGINLVAGLSGHRHTPSAVKLNNTLHLSTGPALMPGRDWSPPQIRMAVWDGSEVRTNIVFPAGASPRRFRSSPPRWSFEARVGHGHSLNLAPHPDGMVVTTADHDKATGRVTVLDGGSGKARWSWRGPQSITTAAAVGSEGEVYVQGSEGTAARIDEGRLIWMIESADALICRVAGPPILTGDGGLIVQGPGFVQCLKCGDGRVRWTRKLSDAGSCARSVGGCLVGGFAVLSLAGPGVGLTVLKVSDGSVAWTDRAGTPPPSAPPADLGDGTVVVVREDGRVERFEPGTGRVRWEARLGRPSSASTPVIIDELVLVVTADASIHILDSKTGWILREHRLGRNQGPATGASVAGGVARVRGVLHVITVAGEWWRLDPFHWEPEMVASLPVAVVSRPIEVGPNLVIPGREGLVLSADARTWSEDRRIRQAVPPSRPLKKVAERWLRRT